MLQVASSMKGYALAATDGTIGSVSDLLFDQTTWTVRWLVVDTGGWLSGRKVLVHPSAASTVDHERQRIAVALTRKQVEDSPFVGSDRPVSQQAQNDIYSYYGWDPLWNGGMFGAGMYGGGFYGVGLLGGGGGAAGFPTHGLPVDRRSHPAYDDDVAVEDGDPNLRSMAEITRYHVHATDGAIGHVESLLLDPPSWTIRYLVVDTANWWFGKHVLISPFAITAIDWPDQSVRLNVTRDKVKGSTPWDPAKMVDTEFERQLHDYYGWPGYRW